MFLILLLGCGAPHKAVEEEKEAAPSGYTDSRDFDPLELPQDKDIVPVKNPQSGIINGSKIVIDNVNLGKDSSAAVANVPSDRDTLNNQVFRVQLYTSKYYNEARDARTVAEEIFDQPVFVDYEVPYFKVRVGNFGSREDAEEYQLGAKAVGYDNAWVVVVNVNKKEAALFYEDLPRLYLYGDSTAVEPDTAATGDEQVGDE
ncbi:MAG: SPOR domain-containing protein [Candidatus Zixiibacteriota bacterium]